MYRHLRPDHDHRRSISRHRDPRPESGLQEFAGRVRRRRNGRGELRVADHRWRGRQRSGPAGNVPLWEGDSVALKGAMQGGATQGVWSTGDTTQSIIVKSAGSYSLTVRGPYGCTATSNVVTVTLTPPPSTPVISARGD